jgi:hypothetical protein
MAKLDSGPQHCQWYYFCTSQFYDKAKQKFIPVWNKKKACYEKFLIFFWSGNVSGCVQWSLICVEQLSVYLLKLAERRAGVCQQPRDSSHLNTAPINQVPGSLQVQKVAWAGLFNILSFLVVLRIRTDPGSADLYLWLTDPEPAIFVSDLHYGN